MKVRSTVKRKALNQMSQLHSKQKKMNLQNMKLSLSITLCTTIITSLLVTRVKSAAFIPSHQRRQLQQHKHLPFHHLQRSIIYSAANKDGSYDFFNEEFDDDDDEDDIDGPFFRSDMSREEQRKMSKSLFAGAFNYDEENMKPDEVHIILFNPNTEREGVHTIEFPKDSGNNIILAFESRVECEQFSTKLKEQHFFDPVVRIYCASKYKCTTNKYIRRKSIMFF